MIRVTFVPATEAHARELAPQLRAEDVAEVLASDGMPALEVLLASLEAGRAWAAYFGPELGAICGVCPDPTNRERAIPWLLTTPVVERYQRAFLRASREMVAEWLGEYPELVQAIDARYEAALRWARRIGFTVGEPAPFGAQGLPFCPIRIGRPHV